MPALVITPYLGADVPQPVPSHLLRVSQKKILDVKDVTVEEDNLRPVTGLVNTAVAGTTDSVSEAAESESTFNPWGWLPEIALLVSFGLLVVAWAFVKARAVNESAQFFLWLGLGMMILPVIIRLASAEPSRRERVGLVVMLGMALYLVKVMHSPVAFTFPDEFSHIRNVREILETHRLFHENPILPITAFYPGLAILSSTLSSLSGLPVFHTGLLVIGAARLILFLALYLLFEQVSGSARAASLATVFYMANPNFLYWTAEYAYEPLALPLLVFVLLMVAKRESAQDRARSAAWTIAGLFGILTVVITHHMSSYILNALLVAITVLFAIQSRGKRWGPWPLTLVALLFIAWWLIFVASFTIDYLEPVLGGAVRAVFQMIVEEETSRALFISSKAGVTASSSTPIWEQLVAITSVVLITMGLPLGAFELWKRHRNKMLALLLGAIALAYPAVQLLRFTSAGWETANRSSEFLFIGVGFVLALGLVKFWLLHRAGWVSKTILAGLGVMIFFGGLIAGWPPRARLQRPYLIGTGNYSVRPQIVTVSDWMLQHLGPDNRIAASKANAKLLAANDQYSFSDSGPVKNLFLSEKFGRTERTTLLRRDIRYIVSDRKNVSWDHMIGYYFYNRYSKRASDLRLIEPWIFTKFEGVEGITRMLDSGDIVIYDVGQYLAAYKRSGDTASLEPNATAETSTNTTGSAVHSGQDPDRSVGSTSTSAGTMNTAAHQAFSMTSISVPGCTGYAIHGNDPIIDRATIWSLTDTWQLRCFDRSSR
jgi:hypothetical protein